MGNPTTYTDELAAFVLQRLADGDTIPQICRANPKLKKETIRDWRKARPEFAKAYDEAMLDGCHAQLDDTLEIADNVDEDPGSRKVRIWARHELIKRKRPDVFSDRQVLAGDPEAPLSGISDETLDAKIQALMKGKDGA